MTFPAYEETEISARNKEALDNAKRTVDTARAKSEELESEEHEDELELLKEKNKILGGF